MRSLLATLVGGLALSLATVFGVQWSMVKVAIDEVMQDYIAGDLAQDADEIFSGLSMLEGGTPTLALAHFDPHFLAPLSGRYYQIQGGGAAPLRSPSLGEASLVARRAGPGERLLGHAAGPGNQALLVSTSGYRLQGQPVTITVAADLTPIRSEFEQLMTRYTRVSVAMFALLLALQAVIVRLAFAPLRRVHADVSRLERGEVGQLGQSVPTELAPLVREVNRLLALLAGRLRRSRESFGNLAHALKAPLTTLTQLVEGETLRREPELARQITEQLDLLRRRVDSELRRARVIGGRVPGVQVDLRTEIESLVATLRKLYRARGLDIECAVADGAKFAGDREDLLELCGNLLDNACKWADGRVRVTVADGAGLVLVVEDDGPGCSAEDLGRIARRGVRLDESTEGHGLGLTIVSSVAQSYGATVQFGRSATLGGFEVRLVFPAA